MLSEPGTLVAGRYTLRSHLGQGVSGVVYLADDRLSDDPVAIKLLNPMGRAASALRARETAALRRARLPGVVELLDEGTDGDLAFVVTRVVDGTPFPGRSSRALVHLTVDVLHILSRVHALDVVHRDIKPHNILVGHDGRPTLLDFGMALDDSMHDAAFNGTPIYASPEQRFGAPPDARSDLYAWGMTLAEVLLPPERARRFLHDRMLGHSAKLDPSTLSGPPELGALVVRLTCVDPAGRPASAQDAVDALAPAVDDVAEAVDRALGTSASLSRIALTSLFDAPERLFHIPSDAAEILASRTSGRPASVIEELRAWIRSGHATCRDGKLTISRWSLEMLERPAEKGLNDSISTMVESTLERSEQLGPLGQHASAIHLLLDALDGSRREPQRDASHEDRLLSRVTHHAVWMAEPRLLELALYELGRARSRSVRTVAMEALAHAALLANRGEGDRALAILDAADLQAIAELEVDAFACRVFAAHRGRREQEDVLMPTVHARYESATDPTEKAQYAWLLARHAYRDQRFRDAAQLHLAEADLHAGTGRIRALTYAASAHLEDFALADADAVASEARGLARAHRLANYEARAERVQREVKRRSRRAGSVDWELVDACRHLDDGPLRATILFNEAAVAWQLGDAASTRALVVESLDVWRRAESVEVAGLASSLAMDAGDTNPAHLARAHLGLQRSPPVIAAQILALLPPHGRPPGLAEPLVAAARNAVPPQHWATPVDVMSLDECARRLAAGAAPTLLSP